MSDDTPKCMYLGRKKRQPQNNKKKKTQKKQAKKPTKKCPSDGSCFLEPHSANAVIY
jgi:hypothetical protein